MRTSHYSVEHIAIALLAGGMSSRMGRPKQLLRYKGKSLLLNAAEAALETNIRPVLIVAGAYRDEIKRETANIPVELVTNEKWREGMASSLHCGLTSLLEKNAALDGIIFMVCDQPFVTGSLLKRLMEVQQESGLPIVASNYDDRLGTPALFHKIFFDEMMELKGDTGARKLIEKYKEQAASVPFPDGHIDIDTMQDYEALSQKIIEK